MLKNCRSLALFLFLSICGNICFSSQISQELQEASVARNPSVLAEKHDDLLAKAKNFEQKSQLIQAAQIMDAVLKCSLTPLLEELCYALSLNAQIAQPDREKRAERLAQRVSCLLNVKETPKAFRIRNFPGMSVQSYLDYLIQQTFKNSINKKIHVDVAEDDFQSFCEWESKARASYCYPHSLGFKNNGKRLEDGQEFYKIELSLKNDTRQEEIARTSFFYRYYEGQLDLSLIDLSTFYNLMVKAGFTEADFDQGDIKGKTGYQNNIYVKPFVLGQSNVEKCTLELKTTLESILKKAKQSYVCVIFNIADGNLLKINEVGSRILGRYLFEQYYPCHLATILEQVENRLYLCFQNDRRQLLDLHGLSMKEAQEKIASFLAEKSAHQTTECTIITGRGNHGTTPYQGKIFKAFPEWVKSAPLKEYVKSFYSISKKGGYRVKLYAPV
jgi:hypothetical protein